MSTADRQSLNVNAIGEKPFSWNVLGIRMVGKKKTITFLDQENNNSHCKKWICVSCEIAPRKLKEVSVYIVTICSNTKKELIMSLLKCKNLTTASMLISRVIIRTWLSFTFSNTLIICIHVFSGSAGDSYVFQRKLHAENVLKILGRSRIASIDITVNLPLFWDWYPVVFTQVTMNHFMFYEGYLL